MQHPNVHTETGFVCLWDIHRAVNNIKHALHKTVAIPDWQIYNDAPVYTMQPQALSAIKADGEAVRIHLATSPLEGLLYSEAFAPTQALHRKLS